MNNSIYDNELNSHQELNLWNQLLSISIIEIKPTILTYEIINEDGKALIYGVPYCIMDGKVIIDWDEEYFIS